jgi:hypothetical protein
VKDEDLPPLEFDDSWMDDTPKIAIGMVEDANAFEVGIAPSLDSAIVIHFAGQQGEPDHALGFRGEAAKKLLASMAALLSAISMGREEEEELLPAPPKKKITLH